jgi:hypothetical protein
MARALKMQDLMSYHSNAVAKRRRLEQIIRAGQLLFSIIIFT